MMGKIQDIYRNLVQDTGYMIEAGRKVQEEINRIMEEEDITDRTGYENCRDKLYGVASIAEEAGFVKGFCFAAGLATECIPCGKDCPCQGRKKEDISAKSG